MGTYAATNWPLTVSHRQFGLGLVMIVLLGLVSTTGMEWDILLFVLIFCFTSCLNTERSKKSIKQRMLQLLHFIFVVEMS